MLKEIQVVAQVSWIRNTA